MKKIIIIGAGPAGLTAAYELQKGGEKDITILEADVQVGGISRTINYKGNRIDIGGHRFFSKSDWVMSWWANILPIEKNNNDFSLNLRYRGQSREGLDIGAPKLDRDAVMLIRNRLSRIYYNRNFFSYPLKLNFDTLRKLGFYKTITFGVSYVLSRLAPIKPEVSLQDFFINRFGGRLYRQFFKDYTEKVWGVPCTEISSEWGAQRIKSLSITKALWHAFKSSLGLVNLKAEQTSLIEHFVYPKFGPGQMWESVADQFIRNGGKLLLESKVEKITIQNNEMKLLLYKNADGQEHTLNGTHFISTMPIKDLVLASKDNWTQSMVNSAANLLYRDFITVGLLYRNEDLPRPIEDNWIYIQEPGVKVGRVQIFNNWSPYLVANEGMVWLGLEFFCKESDALWNMSESELKFLAQKEMQQIGLSSVEHAQDAVVIKVPKAYPGYFGDSYKNFTDIRQPLDQISNLFLIGRNGMHRYNNQDHSMLTAKEAADQIVSGVIDKDKIWSINIDDEYHEESK
jgi:protoporphyrinogen oxidase